MRLDGGAFQSDEISIAAGFEERKQSIWWTVSQDRRMKGDGRDDILETKW